jgi:hypothetical protein
MLADYEQRRAALITKVDELPARARMKARQVHTVSKVNSRSLSKTLDAKP